MQDELREFFRFNQGPDNLPILATPRSGRNRGRKDLARFMASRGYKVAAEIGIKYGQSSRIWLDAMPDLHLACIDPWRAYGKVSQADQDKRWRDAVKNLSPYGERVQVLRMSSMDAVDRFEGGSLDFVNIDGDHDFDPACMDIIRWVPKVRKGGLVLIHDYCTMRLGGVMKAVDAYTHCHRIEPWYVTRDYEPTAFWERGAEKA